MVVFSNVPPIVVWFAPAVPPDKAFNGFEVGNPQEKTVFRGIILLPPCTGVFKNEPALQISSVNVSTKGVGLTTTFIIKLDPTQDDAETEVGVTW